MESDNLTDVEETGVATWLDVDKVVQMIVNPVDKNPVREILGLCKVFPVVFYVA